MCDMAHSSLTWVKNGEQRECVCVRVCHVMSEVQVDMYHMTHTNMYDMTRIHLYDMTHIHVYDMTHIHMYDMTL